MPLRRRRLPVRRRRLPVRRWMQGMRLPVRGRLRLRLRRRRLRRLFLQLLRVVGRLSALLESNAQRFY
jgi:hypothetical protein